MPLVINFHGFDGNAFDQDMKTGLSAKADESGFIALHPQGISGSWNAGMCCGQAAALQIDDVRFVRDLIEAVDSLYCLDRARVFVTGSSNGWYMANRLACEMPDLFVPVAREAGLLEHTYGEPARPVALTPEQGDACRLLREKPPGASSAGPTAPR
jgi:polyhydroxybutyrate depolymerase